MSRAKGNYYGERHYFWLGDVMCWVQRARTAYGEGWRYCGLMRGGGYGYSHPRYASAREAVEALQQKQGGELVTTDPLLRAEMPEAGVSLSARA